MRAPSKRVTFLIAFLVATFLLFFPFATVLDDEPPGGSDADELDGLELPGEEPEPAVELHEEGR